MPPRWLEATALALLAGTVLFNFALAWINKNVTPVSGGQLVAIQGLILAGALGLGLLARGPDRATWLFVLWGMALWWLGLSLFRQAPNPKYLGDIAAFPALALLGALVHPKRFIPLIVALQLLIVVVGLWEAMAHASYGGTLDVAGYYVNTRGLQAEEFNEGLGGLYLNADRPGGRLLLPQTGWRRVASVFLEPVSLGNWTVVVTVFLAVFWRRMGVPVRALLIGTNLLLLVLCDGRLAMLGIAATTAFALVAPRLPRAVPLVLPLVMFTLLVVFEELGALPTGGDTLTGRLAKGLYYFQRLSLTEVMGLSAYVPGYTFDSGWAYFAVTQSIIGFVGFWIVLVFLLPLRSVEARQLLTGITLFFTLGLPVSNSFLSIKAAALLFAAYGSIRRWQDEELAPTPSPKPGPHRAPGALRLWEAL